LLLELSGISEDVINNLFLVVNDAIYSLNDIYVKKDNNCYMFLISNLSLNAYEKRNVNLKLLVDDNYIFTDFDGFTYNFKEEILG